MTKIIASVAGLGLLLTGCTSTADNELGLIKAGTLTVCSDVPFPPFEVEDSSTSTGYSGFDIDIISEIAKRLNLKVSILVTDFDALQSGLALEAGNCDVGASAVTITEERKAQLDYSDPYYDSLQSLLVPIDSPVKTLADMAGRKIGLQVGTTGEHFAQQNAPATAELVSYPTDGEMWLALQARLVDGLLEDYPVNNLHVQTDADYVIIETYNTNEQYGLVLAKDRNPELLAALNQQLQSIRDDGTYQTIFDKYFS